MGEPAPAGAGEMRAERLAVLAHELRSPVAALRAIADAFPSAAPAQRVRLLELAAAAARSIDRLILDASVASVRLAPVDPGSIARDAAEAASLGGAPVRVEIEPGLPRVEGDAVRLRQALDNLIGNAVGHSPKGAEIVVTARLRAGSVLVAVADAGEGIAQADLARVFEPGVRLTDARPGSGLGLAIVRAVATAHGGEVEVESSPGQGTTFTLVLPASAG